MDNSKTALISALRVTAAANGVDPDLAVAHAIVETNLNPFACRHEPNWSYLVNVALYATRLNQSQDTERVQQSTSFGCLQVMGSVARELGFDGYLSQLASPDIGTAYGVLKLASLRKRFPTLEDAVASYNAGSPRKNTDGTYVNQEYVDKVMAELKKLKG